MTPTDCSALRAPRVLPLYSYSMGPLVSPAGSVVAKRVPLARSNPLHTNIGACKESIAPLASKLAVEHGFLHWSHKYKKALPGRRTFPAHTDRESLLHVLRPVRVCDRILTCRHDKSGLIPGLAMNSHSRSANKGYCLSPKYAILQF